MDTRRIQEDMDRLHEREPLSGVVTVHVRGRMAFGRAFGAANRSENIPNALDTRFQAASGSKVFTSVAVCRLVQQGRLSFDTRLGECVEADLPNFDPRVTIHHLLTHTSGVPDYFDEEGGGDYEALWRERPMYGMRAPRDFLPMFQNEPMRFEPGARFSYNDAAFILLGLIVEQHAGVGFPAYVESNIFAPCGMRDSGYFRLDRLPGRTARAYIEDGPEGAWRTNVYSVPIVGGPDGGAYLSAPDMARFWTALHAHRLLDEATTRILLRPHVETRDHGFPTHYGYGVWIRQEARGAPIRYVEGWDPGVAFLSMSFREGETVVTIAQNANRSVWKIYERIAPLLGAL